MTHGPLPDPNRRLERSDGDKAHRPITDDLVTELADLSPKCQHLSVPRELREALIEWRYVLKATPGHMALVQYQIYSGHYNHRGKLDGLVIPWQIVAKTYGFAPATLYGHSSLSAGRLLRWYQKEVDAGFTWAGHNYKKGLARTITDTGIPPEIMEIRDKSIFAPEQFDDWVYLISGETANNKNAQRLREERHAALGQTPPASCPTSASRRVCAYLNGLPGGLFSHGGYGIVSRVPDALDKLKELGVSWQKRDQQVRLLYQIREFPQPLYAHCDYSPRLKADPYNALMNARSDLRPAFYSKKDVELDLTKAHLACFSAVAKREGIRVPTIDRYIEQSLSGRVDLWTGLAGCFDAEALPDAKARRKAAKTSYAAVYGAQRNALLHSIASATPSSRATGRPTRTCAASWSTS